MFRIVSHHSIFVSFALWRRKGNKVKVLLSPYDRFFFKSSNVRWYINELTLALIYSIRKPVKTLQNVQEAVFFFNYGNAQLITVTRP